MRESVRIMIIIVSAILSLVVQMIIISLGATRSVSWVRGVVMLPVHIHKAWRAMVSVYATTNLCQTHLVVNWVRDCFLNDDASSTVCRPYCTPISARIGTASTSAARTSSVKAVAEDAALNAAEKLLERYAGTSSDIDGMLIPRMHSTARTVITKFFWTA